jgi:Domain of unknown function (DUF5060)
MTSFKIHVQARWLIASILSWLWVGHAWALPHFTQINFPEAVGKYNKLEVSFQLNAYLNPYDYEQIDVWAEFTAPSGKSVKVYGFYYEGYRKLDDGAPTSDEILAPDGQQGWKVRFSPDETGTWTFRLKAADGDGLSMQPATGSFSFSVDATAEKGFISKANTRYLKYDSGDPYMPIGDSYPWWIMSPWRASANGTEKGTNIVKHYLDGMHDNGINYNRFELNFYEGLSLTGRDFVLQKTFYAYYNQHDAWQLDEIMEYAKLREINFNLPLFASGCLIDIGAFHYLDPATQAFVYIPDTNSQGQPVTGAGHGCWSLYNPFNRNQDPRYRPLPPDRQGPCAGRYEFFGHPESILAQKKLFRYIVARWGYCTNLMAFELLDELSTDPVINDNDLNPYYVATPPNQHQIYEDWAATMYDFIKAVDPQNHLISTALGDPTDWTLGDHINPHMDFINIHWYFGYGSPHSTEWKQPGEYSFADRTAELTARYDKPLAIMETYWAGDGLTVDPRCYELHNLVWSALFNGSMGLTAVWAHEEEVLGHDALHQYAGVSTYAKTLPLFSKQDVPARRSANGLKCEFLHDPFQDEIYGRVQDENFTFLALWSGLYKPYLDAWEPTARPPLSSSDHTVHLQVHRQGTYEVTWYHTQTGAMHSTSRVTTIDDSLTITMPAALRQTTWADAAFSAKFVAGGPSLLCFPNPGNGIFEIVLKQNAPLGCSYQVFSASGARILQADAPQSAEGIRFSIDLSREAAAVYLLVVSLGNETLTERLVKM